MSNFFTDIYSNFTNWLRNIDPYTRFICIGAFILVACYFLIKFIKKNVNKKAIDWVFFAFAIILVIAALFLAIYE